ncbi:heme A synthase [Falsibacillus albus]|uniref:Heme A synthase n=2 Tax=Falsibacillus albus TaxID=2478915 RepID=A0A3L7JYI9_9BACI|nr:heme A synthase [Falsibacillus albus]
MLFVLLGGALVTKTGSGMGCGHSWPLCEGRIIPQHITIAMVIELAHRLVSGSVGILLLILCVWAWKTIGYKRETKFLAILSLFFLVLQALIGAAAVVWGQSDFVLAIHFGISLVSFASVLLLTLLIFEVDQKFDAQNIVLDKRMKFHIYGITIYSYIVIYSGALVRHTKSSLVCPDWPFCVNSSPAMPENLYEWVQMGHRMAAGLIFIWIAYAAYTAIKHYRNQKVIFWGWIIAFILVCLQAIAGVLVVLSRLNLYITLSHSLFISCLFGLLSYLVLLASRTKVNSGAEEPEKSSDSKNANQSAATIH